MESAIAVGVGAPPAIEMSICKVVGPHAAAQMTAITPPTRTTRTFYRNMRFPDAPAPRDAYRLHLSAGTTSRAERRTEILKTPRYPRRREREQMPQVYGASSEISSRAAKLAQETIAPRAAEVDREGRFPEESV